MISDKLTEFFVKYFQVKDLKLDFKEFKDLYFDSFAEASIGYIHPMAIDEEFEEFYKSIIK